MKLLIAKLRLLIFFLSKYSFDKDELVSKPQTKLVFSFDGFEDSVKTNSLVFI